MNTRPAQPDDLIDAVEIINSPGRHNPYGQVNADIVKIEQALRDQGIRFWFAGQLQMMLWKLVNSGTLSYALANNGTLYQLPTVKCANCKLFRSNAEMLEAYTYDTDANEGQCYWPGFEFHRQTEPGPHWFHRGCQSQLWNEIHYPNEPIVCRAFEPRT
jgi:hypothetical protein